MSLHVPPYSAMLLSSSDLHRGFKSRQSTVLLGSGDLSISDATSLPSPDYAGALYITPTTFFGPGSRRKPFRFKAAGNPDCLWWIWNWWSGKLVDSLQFSVVTPLFLSANMKVKRVAVKKHCQGPSFSKLC